MDVITGYTAWLWSAVKSANYAHNSNRVLWKLSLVILGTLRRVYVCVQDKYGEN